jgi:predicted small lipoprotein YifL
MVKIPFCPKALALALALALVLGPTLAACGKRGPPEPPSEDDTYPQKYPAPETYPAR